MCAYNPIRRRNHPRIEDRRARLARNKDARQSPCTAMDPLSVTASILAVVGAGGTIAKGLHKLVSLKNTPLTLLQLNNEVSDLRLVVGAIEHLIHQYHLPTLSDQPNHQSLCNELQRAKVLILDLERLILYGLSKIGGDGNPKLDRVAWLRSETKVLRKKDRLRNNRINLSAALEILSSYTYSAPH